MSVAPAAYIDQITAHGIRRTLWTRRSKRTRTRMETAEETNIGFFLCIFSLLFGYENQQNWLFYGMLLVDLSTVVQVFFFSVCLLLFVCVCVCVYEWRLPKHQHQQQPQQQQQSYRETRVLTLADNIKTTFQIRMAHVKNGRYNYVTFNPYPFFT